MRELTILEIIFLIIMLLTVVIGSISLPVSGNSVLILGIALLVWSFFFGVRIRTRRTWRHLAERYSLNFTQGSWLDSGMQVGGNIRGHALLLYVEDRDSPTSDTTWQFTCALLRLNRCSPLTLTIDLHSLPKKSVKAPDLLIGDEELDTVYTIRGAPEQAVRALLTSSAVHANLLGMEKYFLTVYDREISCRRHRAGVEGDEVKLAALLELMTALADELDQTAA